MSLHWFSQSILGFRNVVRTRSKNQKVQNNNETHAQILKIPKMQDTEIIVITEKNLKAVMNRIKKEQGNFVVYGMNPVSFKALALNFEQIKKYIEQQQEVIIYYEKSVTDDSQKSDKK